MKTKNYKVSFNPIISYNCFTSKTQAKEDALETLRIMINENDDVIDKIEIVD